MPAVSRAGKGLSDNFITDVYVSNDREVYISNSLGLNRLRQWDASGVERGQVFAEFESISARVGHHGNTLGSSILEDAQGRLWGQNSVIDTATRELTKISKFAGWDVGNLWLGSNEKLKDGTLMFGGTRGLKSV